MNCGIMCSIWYAFEQRTSSSIAFELEWRVAYGAVLIAGTCWMIMIFIEPNLSETPLNANRAWKRNEECSLWISILRILWLFFNGIKWLQVPMFNSLVFPFSAIDVRNSIIQYGFGGRARACTLHSIKYISRHYYSHQPFFCCLFPSLCQFHASSFVIKISHFT